VAEQSIRARGENRREGAAVICQLGVPDRIDTAMKTMERADLQAARNRSPRIAKRAFELPNGHHPVLAGRERRQFPSSLPS